MYKYLETKTEVISRKDLPEKIAYWVKTSRSPRKIEFTPVKDSNYEVVFTSEEDGVTY